MLVDADLVRRLETFSANAGVALTASLAARWPDLGAASAERAGGAVIYWGPGMYVNRARGLGVSTPGHADDVDFVIEFYESRGETPEIELCPYADATIREHAASRGFGPAWFLSLYVMRLADSTVPESPDPHIRLVAVDDARYPEWEDTTVVAFGGSEDVARRFATARHATAGEHDFLAVRDDGEVVGVCSMMLRDGTAELGGMGVVPTGRQQGVQLACLHQRLRIAADAGCDLAVVSATPGGSSARNIERAGFACVYTSIGITRANSRQ